MLSPNVTGTDPWDIVAYEARMLFGLCRLLAGAQGAPVDDIVNNAMVESACLHARVLIDILLPKDSAKVDDIRLDKLLPGLQLGSLEQLRAAYGDAKAPGTHCWTLNKMIMHPTTVRGTAHDYTSLLNRLLPLIEAVWQEIEARHRAGGATKPPSSIGGIYPGLCAKTSS